MVFNFYMRSVSLKSFLTRNRNFIILYIILELIFIFCTLQEIEFYQKFLSIIFDSDLRINFMDNYDCNNILYLPFKILVCDLKNLGFDYIIIWGTNIFQLFIPFFAIFSVLIFWNRKYNSNVKNIFNFSLKFTFTIFAAYLVYYLILILSIGNIFNSTIRGELFIDLVGESFYYNHTYIYYFFDGIIKFFYVPFIYIFSSIILSRYFKNILVFLNFIILYYFGISPIITILEHLVNINFLYINPIAIMISNIYPKINSILLLFSNFILVIISLLISKFRHKNFFVDKASIITFSLLILIINYAFLGFSLNSSKEIINVVYHNISYFIIYLFLSNLLINWSCNIKKNNKLNNIDFCKILFSIFFIILFTFMLLIVIFKIFSYSFSYFELFYYMGNLYIILLIINFMELMLEKVFCLNNMSFRLVFLFFVIFIYIFKYLYNVDFIGFNIFKYYFVFDNFYHLIFHYLIWIVLSYIIINILKRVYNRGD